MTLKSLLFARRIATKRSTSVPATLVLSSLFLTMTLALISQPMVAQTGMISEIMPRLAPLTQETTSLIKSATALTARTIPACRNRIRGGMENGFAVLRAGEQVARPTWLAASAPRINGVIGGFKDGIL